MSIEEAIRLPDENQAEELAELFKYFGDPTRIKILSLLCNGEKCVCDIAAELSMSQSSISHQLNILRKSRLVRTRREGKAVYYTQDDRHVAQILRCGAEHVKGGYCKWISVPD